MKDRFDSSDLDLLCSKYVMPGDLVALLNDKLEIMKESWASAEIERLRADRRHLIAALKYLAEANQCAVNTLKRIGE